MSVRIDHAVSSGTFTLDGETHEVDNNIWVIGDDDECIVIDAPHDVADILAVVGGRTVKAIVCTHAHDDHVRVAPELRERVSAPILLHPADRPVWELTHTDHLWDVDLEDGQTVKVGGAALKVLHTPGHAPGAVCLYVHDLGCVFTGDTLFQGGPGATGRSFSDEDLIKESIRAKLFALPDETVVHTGHGDDTTIGAERAAWSEKQGVRSHGIARTVFAVLLLWSMIILLLPGDSLGPSATNDKVGHLLTFAALALAGSWAQVPARPLLVGLAGYAVATEVLQAVLPINRHGDPRDFLADMAGVLLGLVVVWLVRAAGPAARSPSRSRG